MLQAKGRLPANTWHLGQTHRRLGFSSGLAVTENLLADSVLARHIPGAMEALYPEAWLEHRKDDEEQAVQQTEEVRLTQLTLKLALELSQYFLSEAEKAPPAMHVSSITRTLTTCLTALESHNRELTRELRQQVNQLIVPVEKLELRQTNTVTRAEALRHYTETKLTQLERATQISKQEFFRFSEAVTHPRREESPVVLEKDTERRSVSVLQTPVAAATAQKAVLTPPPVWSWDITAYRRQLPEQTGVQEHRQLFLSLLVQTDREEQETIWRSIRRETELTQLCRRVEQKEETEISRLTRLVQESNHHEYICLIQTLERQFTEKVSADTLIKIQETPHIIREMRHADVAPEEAVFQEKQALVSRAAPVLTRLDQMLKAGRVQREKMLIQLNQHPEAERMAFLTLAGDSGVFSEKSLPTQQWNTAEDRLTILVRKSSRRELEKLVEWVKEKPPAKVERKQTAPVTDPGGINRQELILKEETMSRELRRDTFQKLREEAVQLLQKETTREVQQETVRQLQHSTVQELQMEALQLLKQETVREIQQESIPLLQQEMPHVPKILIRFLTRHPSQQLAQYAANGLWRGAEPTPAPRREIRQIAVDPLIIGNETSGADAVPRTEVIPEIELQHRTAAEHSGEASAATHTAERGMMQRRAEQRNKREEETTQTGVPIVRQTRTEIRRENDIWEGTRLHRRLHHKEIETVAETIREMQTVLESIPGTPQQKRRQLFAAWEKAAVPPIAPLLLAEKTVAQWREAAENHRLFHEDTVVSRENIRRQRISESLEWVDTDTAMVLREMGRQIFREERTQSSVSGTWKNSSSAKRQRSFQLQPSQPEPPEQYSDQRSGGGGAVLFTIRNLLFTDHVIRQRLEQIRFNRREITDVETTQNIDRKTLSGIRLGEQITQTHIHLNRKTRLEEHEEILHSRAMQQERMLQKEKLTVKEEQTDRSVRAVQEEHILRKQMLQRLEKQEKVLNNEMIRQERILQQEQFSGQKPGADEKIRLVQKEHVLRKQQLQNLKIRKETLQRFVDRQEVVLRQQTQFVAAQGTDGQLFTEQQERILHRQQLQELETRKEILQSYVARHERMMQRQILEEQTTETRIRPLGQEFVLRRPSAQQMEHMSVEPETQEYVIRKQMLLHLEEQTKHLRNQVFKQETLLSVPDIHREVRRVLPQPQTVKQEIGVMGRKIRLIAKRPATAKWTGSLPVEPLHMAQAQKFAKLVQEGELQVFREPAVSRQEIEQVETALHLERITATQNVANTLLSSRAVAQRMEQQVSRQPASRPVFLPDDPEVGLELRRTQKPETVRETAAQTARQVVEENIQRQSPELRILRRQSQEQEKALKQQREEIGGLRQQLEKQQTLVQQSMERSVQAAEGPGQVRKLAKAVMRELEDQLRLERQRRGMK